MSHDSRISEITSVIESVYGSADMSGQDEETARAILVWVDANTVPKEVLRNLAGEWVLFPNEAAPPYKPLDAHRCAVELRETIDKENHQ